MSRPRAQPILSSTTIIRMNAPAVLLVPPTPLDIQSRKPSPPSAGTTDSNDSRTTSSSQPETMFTNVDQERASSETTIFSIYSMYGDEQSHRTSWAAQGPIVSSGRRKSKDSSTVPSANLDLPARHSSSFSSSGHEPSSELGLAYDDPITSKPLPVIDLTAGVQDFQSRMSSSTVRSSLQVPRTSYRQPPLRTPSPALEPPPSELLEGSRPLPVPVPVLAPAPVSGTRPTEFRTLTPGPSRSSGYSSQSRSISLNSIRSSQSPPPSHKRQSTVSTRELPPLPPSANTTPPSTPLPQPPRQPSPSILLTPKASFRSHVNPQSHASSPSSRNSLVPSEGEDMDAFHVRQTYALLGQTGVKGDGYEEGIERTRARIGSSRLSQMNADAAVGDGTEKSKALDPKEIELLASVDR